MKKSSITNKLIREHGSLNTSQQPRLFKLQYNERPVLMNCPKVIQTYSSDFTSDMVQRFEVIEESFGFVHVTFHSDPFQCLHASNSFEQVYSYPLNDLYSYPKIFYEVHPDDRTFFEQQVDIVLEKGYNEFVYRIITKDSEVKYLKSNVWCKYDSNGTYTIDFYQKDISSSMQSKNILERNLKKQRVLSDIAIMLNSFNDFKHKIQNIINKVGNTLGADQVSLYEINKDMHWMTCSFIWIRRNVIVPVGTISEIPPQDDLPGYASAIQHSVGEQAKGYIRLWKIPEDTKSILLIPVRIQQKLFGFLELLTMVEKKKWEAEDLDFADTIGNLLANFYDRKAIDDELHLNYSKQELLANVSSKLNKYIEDKNLLLTSVLNYIGANKQDTERIFIYIYQEEEKNCRMACEYRSPFLKNADRSKDEYKYSEISDLLVPLRLGKPCAIDDVSDLPGHLQNLFIPVKVRSILIIPLFVKGKFYGIYGYEIYSHVHSWKKNEIEIAQSFAGIISHFIERQTILRELKKSQKDIKEISESIPGCVFQISLSTDEVLTLNYVSPQLEEWLGFKPTSKSFLWRILQAVHPEDHDTMLRFRNNIMSSHSEITFEGRFFFSRVGFKWLMIKARLSEVLDMGDRVYNGLLIDITENKQTELRLAEAHASIRDIINNLESGILLVDDHSKMLYVNDKLLKTLLQAGVFNPQKDSEKQILEATYKLTKDERLEEWTDTLMKNRIQEKGREIFFYKSAEFVLRDYIPIFNSQRFYAHLFIFNDITPLKLQELEVKRAYNRVRTIIDHSDVGVLLLSENERIQIVNSQFLKMHYINNDPADFVNRPFRVLWDKMAEMADIRGIDYNLIQTLVRSDGQLNNREVTINGWRTVKCFVEPIRGDKSFPDKFYETLIQMVDITAQKNIEQTLRKAKEEAENIARTKSHILTSMSHEIRTPLNGILGFSSLLKDMLTDPYQREMAEFIDESGRRLMDTLNAILDFSVIQSERNTLEITSVNMCEMLQKQIDMHRGMAYQKGLYLYAEIKGDLCTNVAEQALFKILQNLINNAIKYTRQGGVKIQVGVRLVEEKEWLEIRVIDTGVGIDKFKHKIIFEPFRQESEGNERAFEGTGLGLSLVKEYTKKMGGRILLDSKKEEGSVFTVLLPGVYYGPNGRDMLQIGTI